MSIEVSLGYHGIESIEFTEVRHFPDTPGHGGSNEFWRRTLRIKSGREVAEIDLYSRESAAALMIDAEHVADLTAIDARD